jgi:hypothetical protein
MSNGLADADKVSAFLMGVRQKIIVIHLVVDRFPEVKTQQGNEAKKPSVCQSSRAVKDSVA